MVNPNSFLEDLSISRFELNKQFVDRIEYLHILLMSQHLASFEEKNSRQLRQVSVDVLEYPLQY